MNDRFKFRVFLKYNQIMCDIDSYCFLQGLNKCVFHFTNGGQKTLKNSDFIILQCTGLKDKNGKLIYEGDVVKFNFDTDEIIAVVSWDDNEGQVGYYLNTTDYFKDKYVTDYDFYKNDYEVLGNIYENKELLEG